MQKPFKEVLLSEKESQQVPSWLLTFSLDVWYTKRLGFFHDVLDGLLKHLVVLVAGSGNLVTEVENMRFTLIVFFRGPRDGGEDQTLSFVKCCL